MWGRGDATLGVGVRQVGCRALQCSPTATAMTRAVVSVWVIVTMTSDTPS